MFTIKFWKSATERALKTAAQALLLMGIGEGINLLTIDFEGALGIALGGLVFSYLTSIASTGFGDKQSPDLLPHSLSTEGLDK